MNSFSAARSIFGLALRTRGFLSGSGGGAADLAMRKISGLRRKV
jgi:hypothetical protein